MFSPVKGHAERERKDTRHGYDQPGVQPLCGAEGQTFAHLEESDLGLLHRRADLHRGTGPAQPVPGLRPQRGGRRHRRVGDIIFLAALFTGLGWFDRLAKHAGAGTLVPITGFANAVVAPALEFRSEGLVMGVGARMFAIAGPVLAYGISAAVLYGLVLSLFFPG